MTKNQNDNPNQQNDDMSKDKIYQDYNKQKPNLNDPNQNKNHQVGDDEDAISKKREITANVGNKSQESDSSNYETKSKKQKYNDQVE